MFRKFFIHLSLIITCLFLSYSLLSLFHFVYYAQPTETPTFQPIRKILLVPLDSRPPCTDFVKKLARMAGIEIIHPPAELLDKYRIPADAEAIHQWLEQNISEASSAIISLDMLLHGGLWNSRQQKESEESLQKTLALLRRIHHNNPSVRLFAFSIIPRLFLAQDLSSLELRDKMAEWSILQEQLSLFENPEDWQRNERLATQLPGAVLEKYRDLYQNNRRRNFALMGLLQEEVLSGLVIGQDDSTIFGLGNMERQRLEQYLRLHPQLAGKAFVTRGTDEVALNMLNMAAYPGKDIRVFVFYSEKQAPELILPYMPRPLAQTVAEKLSIIGAKQIANPDEADYVLVIHAGVSTHFSQERKMAAQQIQDWLRRQKSVALVDLTMNWRQEQTLLPYLQASGAPLSSLIAYAGWNTASNSVGTAVTQAAMVLRGKEHSLPAAAAMQQEMDRVAFLAERILDDWYYQKHYQHQLNAALRKETIDPYDLAGYSAPTTKRIQQELSETLHRLIARPWQDRVFFTGSDSARPFVLFNWQVETSLPWERTFEIRLNFLTDPAIVHMK